MKEIGDGGGSDRKREVGNGRHELVPFKPSLNHLTVYLFTFQKSTVLRTRFEDKREREAVGSHVHALHFPKQENNFPVKRVMEILSESCIPKRYFWVRKMIEQMAGISHSLQTSP